MKHQILSSILSLSVLISMYSCGKDDSNNPPASSNSNANVLFWTDKSDVFTNCGSHVYVELNTGAISTITSYYPSPPTTCFGTLGGYFSLPAGTYNYTISTLSSCTTVQGTITVIAGNCNFVKF